MSDDLPPEEPPVDPGIRDPNIPSFDDWFRQIQDLIAQQKADQKKTDKKTRRLATKRRRKAFRGARKDVRREFRRAGVRPADYQGDIKRYLSDIKRSIGRFDVNPGQYLRQSQLGDIIRNDIRAQTTSDQQHELNREFQPGFARETEFGDTTGENMIQKQYDEAKTYLDRARARGTLADSGYQSALAGLDEQLAAARGSADDISTGIEADYQQQLRDRLADIQAGIGEQRLSDVEREDPTFVKSKRKKQESLLDVLSKQQLRKVFKKAEGAQFPGTPKPGDPPRPPNMQGKSKFGFGKALPGNVQLTPEQVRMIQEARMKGMDFKTFMKKLENNKSKFGKNFGDVSHSFTRKRRKPGDIVSPVGDAQSRMDALTEELRGKYGNRFSQEFGALGPLFDWQTELNKGQSLSPVRGTPDIMQAIQRMREREGEQRGLGNVGAIA